MTVAAASCTGAASDPASVTEPALGSMVDTDGRDVPEE